MVEPVSMIMGIIGVGVGIIVGWLIAKNRYSTDLVRSEERMLAQEEAMEASKEMLHLQMGKVAKDIASQNSEDFLRLAEERLGKVQSESGKDLDARKKEVENLIKPIHEGLTKLEKATTDMETKREGAYQGLKRTVDTLHKQTTDLRDTNVQLSTALRGSIQARGNWGQISLKNIVKAAGMLEHCDFDVEFTLKSGKGGARVDLLAKIPGGGDIPVDAKVPLASYWDALELTDPDKRLVKMAEHAKEVKKHIDDLVKRDYPSMMDGTDFTVMFIPAEPILSAAYEIDPELQEYAFRKQVLIATPVTLMALLKTVAIYWNQVSMAENAKEIQSAARAFYDRAAKFGEDLAKIGRGLSSAVSGYNDAVGAYDGSVIPAGEKLKKLKVAEGAARDITDKNPQLVSTSVRTVTKLSMPITEEE